MNELEDIEAVRAEALRKLGRNIVNFSKIEMTLKHLLLVSQLDGTQKTISEQFSRKQTQLRKQTLGRVVEEFNKNILSDAEQSEPAIESFQGIGFSVKVTCSNPDVLRTWKRQLSKIVTERNRLIHQDLAYLDTSSAEDYRKLIIHLDEQNPRLLAHLDELGWIIRLVGEGCKVFEELFKSPDFPQCLQSDEQTTT